ncbi:MAG: hypothetical protein A2008_07275 [Candidatus Wallbacteria bacterium GWC2_49_35]|uniref:DUF2079 domain-containing protein n=1 Tax=Candidatus Wallbacteria bacterium GWC2_49_35 TaxID=1817813 RepID=A0A1F7WKH4_9BACT|nr:MAG: hypothetical protein A2008_07275 [Candidatus Wallbacteria bacterium GWC2_49_35]
MIVKTLNILSVTAIFASCLMIFLIIINQADLPFGHFTMVRPFTIVIYIAAGIYMLTHDRPGAALERISAKFRGIISDEQNFRALAGIFFVVYILETLNMWFSFRMIYDFSIFDEALFNGYSGPKFMYSNLLGQPFLAHHFSPVLIPLVPLHAISGSPYFLLLLHPLILFASMPVLRAVLKAAGGLSAFTVNFICLLYLNNPVILKTLFGGFHVEVFLPLALFSAYYFYLKDKPALYYPALLAALSVKEDVGFYLAGLAFFIAVNDKKYRYGLLTAVISISWSLAAIYIAMPYLSDESGTGYPFIGRWSAWGGGIAQILLSMAGDPAGVLKHMLAWPSIGLFSCLLFLPFLRLRAVPLFFIPWLVNSTSSSELSRQYVHYYGLPVLSFAMIAVISGLKWLLDKENEFKFKDGVLKTLCTAALVLNFAHFVFPDCGAGHFVFLQKVRELPRERTVQAAPEVYGHIGYDAKKRCLEDYTSFSADFILLPRHLHDLTRPFSTAGRFENFGAMDILAASQEKAGRYKIIFKNAGFIILEKTGGK